MSICRFLQHQQPATLSSTSRMALYRAAWTVLAHILTLYISGADVTPLRTTSLTLKPREEVHGGGGGINDVVFPRPRPGKGRHALRPHPSDDLPVMPLDYGGDERYSLPTEADLDSRKLQRVMGESFNRAYMASVRPLESLLYPNGTYEYDFRNGRPAGRVPDELKRLAFRLPGSRKQFRIKSKGLRRRVRDYLWSYTYCPVLYTWKDLGGRFWPRWIREGSCGGQRSCSIPTGMTCKVKESSNLTVLWWHCRNKANCRWIPIKYPIVTACGCSC